MKKILIIVMVLVACSKTDDCKPRPPRLIDICINGIRFWQELGGRRGIMVELNGLRPLRCKEQSKGFIPVD
jgi:hypothetical protein